MEQIVNISWRGPFSLKEVESLDDDASDYGLYQIYAHHPVYGRALVYIGKAREQTFAQRIPQHDWGSGSENDPAKVEVYVGRLVGDSTPPLEEWRQQIDAAEKLLVHSHGPAYNTQCIYNAPSEAECGNVRVLNWGACRSVAREVSGIVWTSKGLAFRNQPSYTARVPVLETSMTG
jgi:hypothetical protein